MQPYATNTAYLSDHIEWLAVLLRTKWLITEMASDSSKDFDKEAQLRGLQAKERMWRAKCEKRVNVTIEANKFIPRLGNNVPYL